MTSPQSWDQAHYGSAGPGGPYGTGGQQGPPRNGMGVAALTLGLIGAVLFWTLIGGIVLGLLALIFGIVGYRRSKRGEATNGTLAMVGAIIGGLALVGSTIVLALVASVVSSGDYGELEDCLGKAGTQSEQQQCEDDFVDSLVG
ncbi:hypothetical protein H181DRAFT_05304 [Streptomyces sp. WMMB 714]|uniref:DUF4190 domain-containing protein n=1 Tax=Streptomyces sp. WMMB 714 TaxID=1286822 RepID=UPI0005F7D6ED|nr:DUF4190 domain-containing protein [Streptomyces sp. WMMB 714]SCK56759.1 hypothetical protein H181DRAFT_05304 [Streptomyces sp. WMMB 714]